MKLIVLTGLPIIEKAGLAATLASHYHAPVLDNANLTLPEAVDVTPIRGGCVCCAVAGTLYSSVPKLDGEFAILTASPQAVPDALDRVLASLVEGSSRPVDVTTVALVDERTDECFPYVAERLTDFADLTLGPPWDVSQIIAVVGA